MFKPIHVTLILISFQNGLNFLMTPEDTTRNCSLYSKHHWYLYEGHFFLISFLSLHILQDDEHDWELNFYAQTFLTLMSNNDYQISTRVLKSTLKQPHKKHFFDDISNSIGNIGIELEKGEISAAEFVSIKTLTTDSVEGHIILAWDPESVHRFLDEDYRNVIRETRSTYALVFLTSNCESFGIDFHHILERFWVDYNVANVLAQMACSCDNERVYLYRPFVKLDDCWGVTTTHTLEEIIKNFRLITNPMIDFNRFPLNVSIFERTPTAVRSLPRLLHSPIYQNLSWSKGFAGLDGMMLATLAEYLNFDTIIASNVHGDDFGKVLPNGSTDGTLSDVIEGRAEFHANGRFLAFVSHDQVEFNIPYTSEEVCVVAPKAAKVPRWKFLFKSLDFQSGLSFILTLVACVVFWKNIGPHPELAEVFWRLYSYLAGIPIRAVPMSLDRVFFIVPCLIFSIVMSGVIQGAIFKNLTTSLYYQEFTTLEQVAESGMPIGAFVWHIVVDDSALIRKLKAKSSPAPDNMFDLIAYQRNMFAIDTKSRLDLLIKTKYVNDDGTPLLYIVNECIGTFLTANIVPVNSPFLPLFNDIISKAFEGGLTLKWHRDVVDSMIAEKMATFAKKWKRAMALSLYDLKGGFFVIIVGWICCLFIFLAEVLSQRQWNQKNKIKSLFLPLPVFDST